MIKQGGILPSFVPFYLAQQLHITEGWIIVITPREDRVFQLKDQIDSLHLNLPCLAFPGWDCLPYDRASPSLDITQERLSTLLYFLSPKPKGILVASISSISQALMPIELLKSQYFVFKKGEEIKRSDFTDILLRQGFRFSQTVYEEGEVAIRGGLIDIFIPGENYPFRLDFFGDELESIRPFDVLTQKTTGEHLSSFHIRPAHEILLLPEAVSSFRKNYRALFSKMYPKKNIVDDPLYQHMSEGRPYPGMEHWLPLFYEKTSTLFDYLPQNINIILEEGADLSFQHRNQAIHEYFQNRLSTLSQDHATYCPIPPSLMYWQENEWKTFLEKENLIELSSFQNDEKAYSLKVAPSFKKAREASRNAVFDELKQTFDTTKALNKNRIVTCFSEGSLSRLEHLFQEHDMGEFCIEDKIPLKAIDTFIKDSPIILTIAPFETGFESETCLLLTEQDILGEKIRRPKAKRPKENNFLAEFNQLQVQDFVVHKEHGIARYLGLETVTVNACAHDCLLLAYEGGDKLFLPVENMDLISRYGDSDTLVSLDRLGSSAWQNKKARVKKRIFIIAEELIRLAAQRTVHEAPYLEKLNSDFDTFCSRFPYPETEDQLKAIDDIIEDFTSGKPMDRLVCGDVGFGKTEVALRAAFLAAHNGKQVAVIVPTTLLCRQHYLNFQNRFQGFDFKIAQLSRLVTQKESKLIKNDLEEGRIHIVIATHSLLNDKTKFHDLGLLIIDEEQHFGVKQKEKLKSLKTDVHVLTLTATPIPRTLQLAVTGVKDLSLITTPPIDRLAVRTFVLPYDDLVIREAILREYHRGGQIFYVTPRLEDLSKLKEMILKLVPEVKIGVAHGQLSANELEDVMSSFYDHQFDVLLCTNIIESGIDVSCANTMIVHRCDLFGLSQLYQLRGRVGRAKTQGYAYLTYSPNTILSTQATKRLHVLQSLDTLGAGFNLASYDMDIRGAGNIVGEEQSGHIKEVGVELYQSLLQEAIIMLRAKEANDAEDLVVEEWTPQINLGLAIFIPETYVSDLGLRLNLYRRLAHLKNREEIDSFAAELIDRFGSLPQETKNLLDVVELKHLCKSAHIEKLDAGPKGLVVTFKNNTFPKPEKLIAYLQKPEVYKAGPVKIRPDQKLVFTREWSSHKARRDGVLTLVKNLNQLALK